MRLQSEYTTVSHSGNLLLSAICIIDIIQIRIFYYSERMCSAVISFENFILDSSSPIPIHIQIQFYIKSNIASGKIVTGDVLPARRSLSAILGINPNTVQKAYHYLEKEGIITTRTKAQSVVTVDEEKLSLIRAHLWEEHARRSMQILRKMCSTKDDAFALIEKYWEDNGQSNLSFYPKALNHSSDSTDDGVT